MANLQINTVFNIDLEFDTAPIIRRIAAYFIDLIILCSYLYLMKYLMYEIMGLDESANLGMDVLIISMPMLFYSLLCEVLMNGQSIGKKLMELRVISLDGGEPTLGQFLLRWITRFFEWPFLFGFIAFAQNAIFAYIMVTCFMGIAVLICIAITPKQQRIGDLAAGTVVIDTRKKYSLDDSIFVEISNPDYKVTYPEVMRLSDNDINTIKTVLVDSRKTSHTETLYRLDIKVKEVLQISSNLKPYDFLEKLIEDYNFLATKE